MMTNEVRLIDANALSRKWQNVLDIKSDDKGSIAYQTFELFIDRLKEEPTIAPETLRPKGRWKNGVCMACNFDLRCLTDGENDLEQWVWDEGFDFCPDCGADMRGDSE